MMTDPRLLPPHLQVLLARPLVADVASGINVQGVAAEARQEVVLALLLRQAPHLLLPLLRLRPVHHLLPGHLNPVSAVMREQSSVSCAARKKRTGFRS